ncbi:MAG: RNA-binding domain-containing protein [Nanoarchaeota archaeon]
MKYFNNVAISVFAKPEDDAEKLKQGILALVPLNLEQEKLELQDQKAQGFNERTIHIYSILLEKERHINHFLEFLLSHLTHQQRHQLVREAETRLDMDLTFFVRIDKDIWATENSVMLTDSGNCYHLKFAVAAFPRKRDIALGIVTNVFKPPTA